MTSIFVSKLHKSQHSKDLRVNDSEVVVQSLVHNHVVNETVYLFTNRPNLVNTIDINVLEKAINLFVGMDFVNECSKELY